MFKNWIFIPVFFLSLSALAGELDPDTISREIDKKLLPIQIEAIEQEYQAVQDALDRDSFEERQGVHFEPCLFEVSVEECKPKKKSRHKNKNKKRCPGPEVSETRELFDLSEKSEPFSSPAEAYAAGKALVRYFNDTIKASSTPQPSAELFATLVSAIQFFRLAEGVYDESFLISKAVQDTLGHMMRWPLHLPHILNDRYYPDQELAKALYSPTLTGHIIHDLVMLRKIMKSTHFGNINNPNDLLSVLYNGGFYGYKIYYSNSPQFVWVHPHHYQVRVKKNSDSGEWEFTLGIYLVSPVEWNDQGEAVRRITKNELSNHAKQYYQAHPQYYKDLATADSLLTAQYNEVAKIVLEGDTIKLVPAFMKNCQYYWSPQYEIQDQISTLTQAHRRLKQVGIQRATGTDFKAIEAWCSNSLN